MIEFLLVDNQKAVMACFEFVEFKSVVVLLIGFLNIELQLFAQYFCI